MRRSILLGLLATLLLASVLLTWLLHTESGLRFVMMRVHSTLPALSISAVSGKLTGTIQLDRINYRNHDVLIEVRQARAKFDILPLLFGKISLESLDLTEPKLVLKTQDQREDKNSTSSVSLPSVHVGRLRIPELRIVHTDLQAVAPTVWTTSFDAGLDLYGTHIDLKRLILKYSDYQLQGDLAIDLDNDWLIENAHLMLTNTDNVARPLQVLLTRKPQSSIELQVTRPIRATLQVQPDKLLGDFRAWLSLPAQDTSSLGFSFPESMMGEVNLRKTSTHISVHGNVELDSQPILFQNAKMQWLSSGLQIDALTIVLSTIGELDFSGYLPFSAHESLALKVVTKSLQLQPTGQNPVQITGTISAVGMYSDLSITPDLTLHQKGRPPGAVSGTVSIVPQSIHFDALVLRLPRGAVTINGSLARDKTERAELALKLAEFDPSMFIADWPGEVSGDAQWNGTWDKSGVNGLLRITGIDGRLREQSFSLKGQLQLINSRPHDTAIKSNLGNSHLQIDGDITGPGALSINFNAPDLAALHNSMHGQVRINVTRDRVWRIDAQASDLEWGNISLDTLALNGSVSLGKDPNVDLRADLHRLRRGDLGVTTANLTLVGNREEHILHANVEGEGDHGNIELAANGSWSERHWDGVIKQLNLRLNADRHLRLEQPVNLQASTRLIEVSQACWSGEQARLCLQGDYGGGNGTVALNIEALPLNWLSGTLIENKNRYTLSDAVLHGRGSATWAEGSLRNANLALTSEQGRLLLPERPDLILSYRALQLAMQFDGSTGEATASAELLPEGRVDANFQLLRDAGGTIGYDGNVTVLIRQLDAIEAFTTEIANPTGQINGQFRLQQDLTGFRLSGAVALSDFKAEVPGLGLSLKHGSIALAGVPGGMIVRGAIQSGDGTLTFDGNWTGTAQHKLALHFRGENVQLSNTPELSLIATPDLKLERNDQGWDLSGMLDIPRARIQADQLNGQNRQSADVVIVDDPPSSTPQQQWRAHINLRMGDNVELNGFGFHGELRGQLSVRQSSGRTATASGQLDVTGLYEIYGQKLNVARGELLYAGSPLDEPTLALRAERKTGDSTAGIEITGTAKRPVTRVYARPALSESEALALLVTGRPLRDVRGGDINRLSGAALALGTIGGDLLAKNLGLDELGVSSNSGLQGEAFTIGKYLSPRLYVGYGIGLLTRGEVFTIRYLINERIEAEASIGERQRAAVNYRIER